MCVEDRLSLIPGVDMLGSALKVYPQSKQTSTMNWFYIKGAMESFQKPNFSTLRHGIYRIKMLSTKSTSFLCIVLHSLVAVCHESELDMFALWTQHQDHATKQLMRMDVKSYMVS